MKIEKVTKYSDFKEVFNSVERHDWLSDKDIVDDYFDGKLFMSLNDKSIPVVAFTLEKNVANDMYYIKRLSLLNKVYGGKGYVKATIKELTKYHYCLGLTLRPTNDRMINIAVGNGFKFKEDVYSRKTGEHYFLYLYKKENDK